MLLAGQFATAPKVLELIWALDRKLTGESLQADQSDMLPRGNWAARVTVTLTAVLIYTCMCVYNVLGSYYWTTQSVTGS